MGKPKVGTKVESLDEKFDKKWKPIFDLPPIKDLKNRKTQTWCTGCNGLDTCSCPKRAPHK